MTYLKSTLRYLLPITLLLFVFSCADDAEIIQKNQSSKAAINIDTPTFDTDKNGNTILPNIAEFSISNSEQQSFKFSLNYAEAHGVETDLRCPGCPFEEIPTSILTECTITVCVDLPFGEEYLVQLPSGDEIGIANNTVYLNGVATSIPFVDGRVCIPVPVSYVNNGPDSSGLPVTFSYTGLGGVTVSLIYSEGAEPCTIFSAESGFGNDATDTVRIFCDPPC